MILLETFVPNLISLSDSSLLTLGKMQTDVFPDFRISGQSFTNKNCHNPRTNHDIDMERGPVTKLDNRKTTTPKKLTTTSSQQTLTPLFFSDLWPVCSHPEAYSECMVQKNVYFN